jgi:hypothetical protein
MIAPINQRPRASAHERGLQNGSEKLPVSNVANITFVAVFGPNRP